MDFLSFSLDLVAAEMNIPRADLVALEMKIREDKGKDRHYIASAAAMRENDRVRMVFEAFRQGVNTREIAERVGISQRRVQQIIARTPMP